MNVSEDTKDWLRFIWALTWRVLGGCGALFIVLWFGNIFLKLRKDEDRLLYRTWVKVYRYDMSYEEWYRLRTGDDLPKNPKP